MSKALAKAARAYARLGWKVFPTWGVVHGRCECGKPHMSPKDMGKHPLGGSGHLDASTDRDYIEGYWPDGDGDGEGGGSSRNIGVPCAANGLVVIDVDPRNGGRESFERLRAEVGDEAFGGLMAWTGRWESDRGRHYYFLAEEGVAYVGKIDGYPGIDVKHQGYVLAAPSVHGSGEVYEWSVKGGPLGTPVAAMPPALRDLVVKGTLSPREGGGGGAAATYGVLSWKGRSYDVDELLRKGIPEGERIDTLYPVMCALANQYPVSTGHGAAGFRGVVRALNAKGCRPPLPDDELDFQMKRAIQFVIENPKERMIERELGTDVLDWVAEHKVELSPEVGVGGTGGGSAVVTDGDELLREAAKAASGGSGSGSGGGSGGSGGGALPGNQDETPIPEGREWLPRSLTDMGNARRLADHFDGKIKYTEGRGWFVWEDAWVEDPVGALALSRAGEVLPSLISRELAVHDISTDRGKDTAKWAVDSRSTARLKACMEQWKVREGVRTPVSAWDSKKDLLGVRNGVVDLRTGELLKSSPELGITKRTAVAYERGMRAAQWEQFLEEATGGDKELQAWLQLAAGYTMTGRNDYDVFFIVFGPSGSGKSTFLEAMQGVLGEEYSTTMPTESLMDDGRGGGGSGQDAYYLAQLPGKRLAVYSEWAAGKRTNESKIKQMTGDLTMTGRQPGGQPFTFRSEAKLWLGTNVTPAINDAAMWRRIRAIPFRAVPEKPNPDLKIWLSDPEGGLPAVLSWCVEGAVKLLGSGSRDALGWCSAVREASSEYRSQEDRIGQFLEEECVLGAGREAPLPALFDAYGLWSEERGEKGMTRIPFEKALAERGIAISGRGRHAIVEGMSLQPRTVNSGGSSGAGGSMAEFRAIAASWEH